MYLIEDARNDPRSLADPLVTGELGLQFYAAAPLKTQDGFNLGTFCIIDRIKRYINSDQQILLRQMADIVMHEMELRLAARTQASEYERRILALEKQINQNYSAVACLVDRSELETRMDTGTHVAQVGDS